MSLDLCLYVSECVKTACARPWAGVHICVNPCDYMRTSVCEPCVPGCVLCELGGWGCLGVYSVCAQLPLNVCDPGLCVPASVWHTGHVGAPLAWRGRQLLPGPAWCGRGQDGGGGGAWAWKALMHFPSQHPAAQRRPRTLSQGCWARVPPPPARPPLGGGQDAPPQPPLGPAAHPALSGK